MSEIPFPGPISPTCLNAFRIKKQQILDEAVKSALKNTDEVSQHGDQAARLIRSGFSFTLDVLESAMTLDEPALLKDQLQWALIRLPHEGVTREHLISRFNMMQGIMKYFVPTEEVDAYFRWMVQVLEQLGDPEDK